jgi:hypothetical protein
MVAGTNVASQQFTSTGQLLGAPVIVGANPGFPPAVAVAPAKTNSLVAWTDYSVASGVTMFCRLLSAGGVGSTFPLLTTVGGHGVQAVQAAASDGTNFLAVWRDNTNNSYYGQKVTSAGTLSGSEFLLFTMAGEGDRDVAVAFGQTNYLIAWQDGTESSNQTYCELISPVGSVGSAFQINTSSSSDMNPVAIALCEASSTVLKFPKPSEMPPGCDGM